MEALLFYIATTGSVLIVLSTIVLLMWCIDDKYGIFTKIADKFLGGDNHE